MRKALGANGWLDPGAVAASAAHLADADEALDWAADQEWQRAVTDGAAEIVYRRGDAPPEISRRIVARAVLALASEGEGELRGRELDQLLAALAGGGKATLRGVVCTGGAEWRFGKAPQRKLAR